MMKPERLTLFEIAAVVCSVALVSAIVVPAIAVTSHSTWSTTCVSNLRRIGSALQSYCGEWDGRYPTNRRKTGSLLTLSSRVQLSLFPEPQPPGCDGKPRPLQPFARFYYGINWVEALYDYTGLAGDPRKGSASPWRCPAASGSALGPIPGYGDMAAVTYVFNYNLVEQSERVINKASNIMVVREFDRLVNAELRPSNFSYGSSTLVPQDAFLSKTDMYVPSSGSVPPINPVLHSVGSHILLADGHVTLYDRSYMPNTNVMNASKCLDSGRWYNFNTTVADPALRKSIAITP